LSGPEGAAGLLRIAQLQARLTQAERGGPDPDETDDSEEGDPNVPTHVNPQQLIVLETPNGRRADCEPIPPFTGLTVQGLHEITIKGTRTNWALIARKAVPLGYVREAELRPLL